MVLAFRPCQHLMKPRELGEIRPKILKKILASLRVG
ncbi:MAG: hypothetical protein ACI9UA_006332, partial [Pseudoalteromonas tetraodonis]